MNRLSKLRIEILKKGITQKQVADQSGLPESTISLICNNRLIPLPCQRARISKALKVSESKLFE